eukprot:881314-Pyramimonas_sp.AAC.1
MPAISFAVELPLANVHALPPLPSALGCDTGLRMLGACVRPRPLQCAPTRARAQGPRRWRARASGRRFAGRASGASPRSPGIASNRLGTLGSA